MYYVLPSEVALLRTADHFEDMICYRIQRQLHKLSWRGCRAAPFAAMHRQVVVTGQRQKPTVTLIYILGSRNGSVYFSVASLCFTFLFLHLDFCNLSGRLISFSLLLESRNMYVLRTESRVWHHFCIFFFQLASFLPPSMFSEETLIFFYFLIMSFEPKRSIHQQRMRNKRHHGANPGTWDRLHVWFSHLRSGPLPS